MNDGAPPLKTIDRAFEILELLNSEKSIGVAEVARQMDLPKSTVHDYLRSLRMLGFVVQEDGAYRLGFRLLELGGRMKYRNRLFHVAKPELERLVARTDEMASVNVEERGQFVVLHAEKGDESLQLGLYPGITIPIHTHAAGKSILVGFSDERIERILDEHGLEPVTEQTITDRAELLAEIETIRERGYGVDWNEQIVGMGVVASPVEVDKRVVGSIGLVCPTDRLDDEDYRAELVREVQKSANIVSVNYQYS
jgi:DNA-binding IclR family transcriptional regulator